MLTIGSLFSGIGGLELGLEMAGLGPTLWQVERDPFCRAVLEKHWPEARRFDDVCTVGAAQLVRPDLICGGFPCQDVSSAGLRAGLSGKRSGLWREFARIVGELRPEWVVVENVASGAVKWVDPVVSELEQFGYASLPIPLSASDVGAPHQRARVFIVASRAPDVAQLGCDARKRGPKRNDAQLEDAAADANGDRVWLQHGRASGAYWSEAAEPEESAPDASHDAGSVQYTSRRGVPGARRHSGWTSEPDVARVVHGLPGRVDRERSLGNSVVPQQAEVVGWVVRELLDAAARQGVAT